MREMVYTAKRLKLPERIAEGAYKGFTYYVLSLGTHPCAYVDVTDTNLHGVDYSQIDCHGGLSYSEDFLATVEKKGWFIGWDYAHCTDFAGYEMEMLAYLHSNEKKWTTAEIVKECKKVIDQIVNITKDSNKEKGGAV